MKKILAVVLSLVMILSVGFGTSAVAFAADVIGSQETTVRRVKPSVTVNGNTTSDITYDVDEDNPNEITFTYTGDGELESWNFYDGDGNLLIEGVDYKVVYTNNKATVVLLRDIDEVVADAKVKEATTAPEKTTKPNGNNESPDTGAMGLSGLAVAGAGVALLAAMKRKSDAE